MAFLESPSDHLCSYIPVFLLIFLVAAVTAAVLTPVAQRLGDRLGWVDRPGGRRKHRGIISRLGGMAMYAGFTVGVLATLLLPQEWFPPRLDPNEWYRLTGLLIGTTAAFVFGLLDDRFQFPSRPQYIAQFLLSLIAVVFIIFIERINDPLGSGQIVFPWPVVWGLTIFWFMGMINTVNWLDGLDGLAAGVSAILAAFLIIHMIREGQFSVALLPVALLGAVLGFLPFNFNPARVFMGSSGSYFLGWALAALAIIGGAKVATVLLVMSLPILDVAWLIYDRWRRGDRRGTQRPRSSALPAARHRLHPATDCVGVLRILCDVRGAGVGAGLSAVQAGGAARARGSRAGGAGLGEQAAGARGEMTSNE